MVGVDDQYSPYVPACEKRYPDDGSTMPPLTKKYGELVILDTLVPMLPALIRPLKLFDVVVLLTGNCQPFGQILSAA